MRAESFDTPPLNGEATDQLINQLVGILFRVGCQVGISGSGQYTAMAEDLLHFEYVDTRFDQVGRIAVSKRVRGNLFFIPQSFTTLRRVL